MNKIMTTIGIIALLLVLLLAGLGVWAYYEFLYTEPLTEQELAELTPDWDLATHGNWSPWYDAGDGVKEWNPTASYNAWLATVAEDNKAWPILIDAYYDHMDSVYQSDLFTEHSGTLPEHPKRWALYLELVETDEVAVLCEKLKEASTRPVLGCELLSTTDPYERVLMLEHGIDEDDRNLDEPPSESLVDVLLPWLGKSRGASHILSARAAYELEQGNVEECIALIESMDRLSRRNQDVPFLISSLVEIAIDSTVHRTIDWALASHGDMLNESHLSRLDAILASHEQVHIIWTGEVLFFHDAVRRMCDADGDFSAAKFANNDFAGTACSLPLPELDPAAQRMLYVQHVGFQQGPLLAGIPWDERVESMHSVVMRERESLNKLGELTLDLLIPSIDNAAGRERAYHQQAIGTRLAVAAYRHRLRNGSLPESLIAFDKDLIGFNPIDAFNGQPLQYKVVGDQPIIYSVGDDRTDDGGLIRWEKREVGELGNEQQIRVRTWPQWYSTQRAAEQRLNVPESIVGDWVLFPMPVDDPDPIDEHEVDEYED